MTGPDSGLEAAASAWREADPDPETRAEVDRLLGTGAVAELAERFEGSLAFGTAGIRAAMGAGPMRMNRLVAGGWRLAWPAISRPWTRPRRRPAS